MGRKKKIKKSPTPEEKAPSKDEKVAKGRKEFRKIYSPVGITKEEENEILAKHSGSAYNPPEYFTPDEHAERILSYGYERANSLLKQSRGKWGHVNWNKVEEELNKIK